MVEYPIPINHFLEYHLACVSHDSRCLKEKMNQSLSMEHIWVLVLLKGGLPIHIRLSGGSFLLLVTGLYWCPFKVLLVSYCSTYIVLILFFSPNIGLFHLLFSISQLLFLFKPSIYKQSFCHMYLDILYLYDFLYCSFSNLCTSLYLKCCRML